MSNLRQILYIDIPSKSFSVQPEALHVRDYIDLELFGISSNDISENTFLSLSYMGETVAMAVVSFVDGATIFDLHLDVQEMIDAFAGKSDEYIDNLNILIEDQGSDNIILNTLISVANTPDDGNLDVQSILDFIGATNYEIITLVEKTNFQTAYDLSQVPKSYPADGEPPFLFTKASVNSETKLLSVNHGLGQQRCLRVAIERGTGKQVEFDDIISVDDDNLNIDFTEGYGDMSGNYYLRVTK